MGKCVNVICEQQRHRSACASAQSDQRLCFRCLDSIISLDSIASVAAQAGLCLAWSETHEDTFCHVVAHIYVYRLCELKNFIVSVAV